MKKTFFNTFTVITLVLVFTVTFSGISFADHGHHKGRDRHEKDYHRVVKKTEWYVPLIFRNMARLYWTGRLERRTRPATVIVAPPSNNIIVGPSPVINGYGDINVNIPNNNGSYTAVALRKYGNGYIGPQNEYYPERPTVRQLEVLYGN